MPITRNIHASPCWSRRGNQHHVSVRFGSTHFLAVTLMADWFVTLGLVFGGCCRYVAISNLRCRCVLTWLEQCPHVRTCYLRISKVGKPDHLFPIPRHLSAWAPKIRHIHLRTTQHPHTSTASSQNTHYTIPCTSRTFLLYIFAQQPRIWL